MSKKILASILATSLLAISANAIAASCTIDKQQMDQQISVYGSIATAGCPYNELGFGIAQVIPSSQNDKSCQATCVYEHGGSTSCNWKMGNWGNTLTCNLSGPK